MTNLTVGTRVSYRDGSKEGLIIAVILPVDHRQDRVRVKMPNGTIYEETADNMVKSQTGVAHAS